MRRREPLRRAAGAAFYVCGRGRFGSSASPDQRKQTAKKMAKPQGR